MSDGHGIEFADVDEQVARSVAETMQALAAPSRVRILSRLAAGPCSVTELAQDVGMGQPAVSQQLRVLRHLGLVLGLREGRRVVYELHDDHVRALLGEAISHSEHIRLGIRAHSGDPAAGVPAEGAVVPAEGAVVRAEGAVVPAEGAVVRAEGAVA